jgi:formate--tetrahydrofolate ligase
MKGSVNLVTHIENMKKFGLPVVVAINRFHTDTEAEIAAVREICSRLSVEVSLTEIFAKGGEGGKDLADKVCSTIEKSEANGETDFKQLYDTKLSIKEKLRTIAREIYRADDVVFSSQAEKALKEIEALGFSEFPICVAKTQYSLSDDPSRLGKPENFVVTVRDLKVSAGAGFVVAYTGDIMTMPGLPKKPSALRIDCDNDGNISGLF